jgi:hypothetical protein
VDRFSVWMRSRPLAVSMVVGGMAMLIVAIVWALIAHPF